jgi:hypothetical protein
MARLNRLRNKSFRGQHSYPQGLKPALNRVFNVRAEARTLQNQSFSAACEAVPLSRCRWCCRGCWQRERAEDYSSALWVIAAIRVDRGD